MRTPSQTVGPFFSIGLDREPRNELPGGSVRVRGRIVDGEGAPVSDALVEVWHPDVGFGRCATDGDGEFSFLVPPEAGSLEVIVFARGLLKPVVTRIYLSDGDAAEDPTMVARHNDGEMRFDVRLQGEGETAFFEL
jgi:protocatechuate 3,4-dioxygenase, alpha subunit